MMNLNGITFMDFVYARVQQNYGFSDPSSPFVRYCPKSETASLPQASGLFMATNKQNTTLEPTNDLCLNTTTQSQLLNLVPGNVSEKANSIIGYADNYSKSH